MSVIDKFTDMFSLTDSEKPLRQAEEQARRQMAMAEKQRQQSNEMAQQANVQQQQMAERARVQEQASAALAASKPSEAEVDIATDGSENATRRRTKFQAASDPMASIRI